MLADYAVRVEQSRGRRIPEPQHPYRNDFQRDRDRVIHGSRLPERRIGGYRGSLAYRCAPGRRVPWRADTRHWIRDEVALLPGLQQWEC